MDERRLNQLEPILFELESKSGNNSGRNIPCSFKTEFLCEGEFHQRIRSRNVVTDALQCLLKIADKYLIIKLVLQRALEART